MRKCDECQVSWKGVGPCWVCGGPGRYLPGRGVPWNAATFVHEREETA